ncbi:TRML2 protein, partial [Malurus elegans]|nr:TRML2 protein [Malurus elegans]
LRGQTLEAKRREGGTLHIQCPYHAPADTVNTKYWCRKVDGKCQVLVDTYYNYKAQTRDMKITIEDDYTSKTVSITMTDLKAEDSGTYFCAYHSNGFVPLRMVSLFVSKGEYLHAHPKLSLVRKQSLFLSSSFNVNTFIILSAVLLLLLLLALVTSVALGVRHYRLLRGAGNREAEDTSDRAEGTAQPGSPGRRESSQDDSKGPAYINLEVQSSPSPEDPLYCNVEQSQAPRNPRNVEYAVIAFNQTPRNDRG